MPAVVSWVAKFSAVLLACILACTFLWQRYVADHLYHCTDPGWLEFLSPGDWVHDPVEVASVRTSPSMDDADTIRKGWSVARLWYLWLAATLGSLIASAWLACLPWGGEGRPGAGCPG